KCNDTLGQIIMLIRHPSTSNTWTMLIGLSCLLISSIIIIQYKNQNKMIMSAKQNYKYQTSKKIQYATHSKRVLGLLHNTIEQTRITGKVFKQAVEQKQNKSMVPISNHVHQSEIFGIPNKVNREIFLYNRIPKCGSSTLLTLFNKMAAFSNYTSETSTVFLEQVLSDGNLQEFVEHLVQLQSKIDGRLVYDRHIHYVNFERFGYRNPIYFNMVRDPFEQAMSWYYYMFARQSFSFISAKQRATFTQKHKWKTYGKCIEEYRNTSFGLEEMCFLDEGLYAGWFCGHADECKDLDIGLPIAKQHIERYTLIGLTEELSLSLKALEKLIPSYFRHISEFDKNNARLNAALGSRNVYPAKKLVNFIKVKLKYSYEIYNFIKQKFHLTLRK
ncbi:unnamed protein product, partial [Owenia fusiformis]